MLEGEGQALLEQPDTDDAPEYRTWKVDGSTYAVVLTGEDTEQVVAWSCDPASALKIATALNEAEGL
jgi:hypothetical protein